MQCVNYEKEQYPDIFTAESGKQQMGESDTAIGLEILAIGHIDLWEDGIKITREAIRSKNYDRTVAIARLLGDIFFADIGEYLNNAGSHYRRSGSDNTQEAIKYYYYNSDWTKLLGFFEINVDKYISRFINKHYEDRTKKDESKKDLLKAIHYSLLYIQLREQMK